MARGNLKYWRLRVRGREGGGGAGGRHSLPLRAGGHGGDRGHGRAGPANIGVKLELATNFAKCLLILKCESISRHIQQGEEGPSRGME